MIASISRLAFIPALVSWTLISCSAPVLKTEVLAPAKSSEASRIREIAVLPFDGPNGKEMTADLYATLAGIMLEEKPYFTLADPAQVEKTMKEQGISQAVQAGETALARVGKILGVKGVYTGMVTALEVKNIPSTETRRFCAEWRTTSQTVSKPPDENCVKWQRYNVECLKMEGVVAFNARLIDVETGRVVYRTSVREDTDSSACEDSKTPPPRQTDLIHRAKDRAKLTFRKEVAPSFIDFDIPLMESKEGLASKEAEQKLEQGLESVKRGRLDSACELWEAGARISPQSPSLAYNLAVCAEAREDWKASSDLYQKARQALGKPDDRITWGLDRVAERQRSLKDQRK
jgi:hypothetical protein